MRSFVMIGLIMLASINCGFWKKGPRPALLYPEPKQYVRVDNENDGRI